MDTFIAELVKDRPYQGNQEYIDDLFYFYDSILDYVLREAYQEAGIYDEDGEDEEDNEEDLPPSQESLQRAYYLIKSREKVTPEGSVDLLDTISQFKLSEPEEVLLWIILLPYLSEECHHSVRKLLEIKNKKLVTWDLYFNYLSYVFEIDDLSFISLLSTDKPLGRYFLLRKSGPFSFEDEVVLRKAFLHNIQDKSNIKNPGFDNAKIYSAQAKLFGLDSYVNQLKALLKKHKATDAKQPYTIKIEGPRGSGKKSIIAKTAEFYGAKLLVVDLKGIIKSDFEDQVSFLQELLCQAVLTQSYIYIEYQPYSFQNVDLQSNMTFLEGISDILQDELYGLSFCFCCLPDKWVEVLGLPYVKFSIDRDMSLQHAVWEGCMKQYDVSLLDDAGVLASRYNLPAASIIKAMKQADLYRRMDGEKLISPEHLKNAIYSSGTIDFDGLATRVPSSYGLKDIELSDRARDILQLVIKRVSMKYQAHEQYGLDKKVIYGNGINILFYGRPGTGKTMCAQVLAHELGLELYRVDTSQLMSKYVGETEKNLSKVFDAAETGNVILFFDEADSLFSQRTDVKDNHDKSANAEVSFLLQKMESYPGISILATNLMKNFDPAVMRRLTYSINFEMPDMDTVLRLWHSVLPQGVTIDPSIDLKYLSDKLDLTGSKIKSILYNAIYIAAGQENEPLVIKAEHLVLAIQLEFEKLGQYLEPSTLGRYSLFMNKYIKQKEI